MRYQVKDTDIQQSRPNIPTAVGGLPRDKHSIEQQVLAFAERGLEPEEIADKMFISRRIDLYSGKPDKTERYYAFVSMVKDIITADRETRLLAVLEEADGPTGNNPEG